jgi:hypothetical protein
MNCATVKRIVTALHAALGRWLARTDLSAGSKSKCSWFGCDAETIHAALPLDPDDEVATRRRRNTFRIGQLRS